jgi:16S rRNA (guanine527-N7)-methyltransferase
METEVFRETIEARLMRASTPVDSDVLRTLARYLQLLARWNRRINLTAFDLDRPTDQAIDRLIVEPVRAARELRSEDRVLVDVGSGGGSPALPLKIARPDLQLSMIEARVRKSAFLREAIRELDLKNAFTETTRLGRAGLAALNGTADVVTLRAVRPDHDVLDGVANLLTFGGRLFWFQDTSEDRTALPSPPEWTEVTATQTALRIFLKT